MNIVLKPHAVLVLAALTFAGRCVGPERADNQPPRTATQYVVAVDLSTSLTPTDRARHASLLRTLAATLDYGDQLVLLKAHAAGVKNDTSTPATVTMPTPRGRNALPREKRALELQRQTADLAVTSLFEHPATDGSDLLATMHSASERARQSGGKRPLLVVLSDMLHCTDSLCIENPRRDPPDSAWISARKEQGLVPPLNHVCVAVVGADASTPHGVKVREFWRRYFQAAGADFTTTRYVHGAASPATLRC